MDELIFLRAYLGRLETGMTVGDLDQDATAEETTAIREEISALEAESHA